MWLEQGEQGAKMDWSGLQARITEKTLQLSSLTHERHKLGIHY
jgi:hypothetical protein